jgi:hypothetical protein
MSEKVKIYVVGGGGVAVEETHLPVFGITLEHDGILGLADLVGVILFNLLHILLGRDALIFGKGAAMALLLGSAIR